MFGADCLFYARNGKSASRALLHRYLVARVRYGGENRLGDTICLFRIAGLVLLRPALFVQHFKPAFSDCGGNNARQLEVVNHVPPCGLNSPAPADGLARNSREEPNFQGNKWFPSRVAWVSPKRNQPAQARLTCIAYEVEQP